MIILDIMCHNQVFSLRFVNFRVSGCIIKPGLPEGRSDQGGRAVELGGGYIS